MTDEHLDDALEHQLAAERPVPGGGFRGALRRNLLAARPGRHRPEHLWALAGASAAVGVVLLALGAAFGI